MKTSYGFIKGLRGLLYATGFAVAFASTLGAACRTESNNSTSFDACLQDCPNGMETYSCSNTIPTGEREVSCQASLDDAFWWCDGLGGDNHGPFNCEAELVATGDTGWTDPWDPDPNVTLNTTTGEYEVDADFVAALEADGFAALGLDSARLEQNTSGYYKLISVASTDLAAHLGLQTDDIIKSINSYDLDTLDERLDAYQAYKNDTSFTLTVLRGTSTVTLNYKIVN